MEPCAQQPGELSAAPPTVAKTALERGKQLVAAQQWLAASEQLRQAVTAAPDVAEAYFYRGLCSRNLGRLEEAMEQYATALRLDPSMFEAAGNLGSILLLQRRHDEAERVFAFWAERCPEEPAFTRKLAVAKLGAGNPREALALLRPHVEQHPEDSVALVAVGNALLDLGHVDRAIQALDAASWLCPDDFQVNYDLSQALLLGGHHAEGWEAFEWRLQDPRRQGHAFEDPRRFTQPAWDGHPLEAGETLLLLAEEGLGDTLMFVRFAQLAARGGARIVLECQPGLQRLLDTAPGVDQVLPRGAPLPLEQIDHHAPLMSLPLLLGQTTVPGQVPYLRAEEQLVRRWREALPAGPALRVGLCWRGSDSYALNHRRSLSLGMLAPLAELALQPGLQLVNLQRGPGLSQLSQLPEGTFVDLGAEPDTGPDRFVDSAALMQSLDLVITCDTSVAHLAGALGRPVWLLLCATPNWRWMLEREDCPWYPSMRIFRQPEPGDWAAVVGRVRGALTYMLGENGR